MILNCPYAAQWKPEAQKCNSKEGSSKKNISQTQRSQIVSSNKCVWGWGGGISGEKYANS